MTDMVDTPRIAEDGPDDPKPVQVDWTPSEATANQDALGAAADPRSWAAADRTDNTYASSVLDASPVSELTVPAAGVGSVTDSVPTRSLGMSTNGSGRTYGGVVIDSPVADVATSRRERGLPAIAHTLRGEPLIADDALPARPPRALHVASIDDRASLFGSMAGSLALSWVLYERVLPFSGTLGFLACWFVTFLGTYSAVTALSYPRPMVADRIAGAVVTAGAAIVVFALTWTILWIFRQGLPALIHPNFYLQDMAGVGLDDPLTRGGVSHAIVGTAIMVGIATVIALPLGVGTAIFMTEVGGRSASTVRTVVEAMTALPDILAGLFVYVILIITLGWDKSGLAASLALVVTMMPIIARSAEVVLRVVPGGLREASLALGASQWQTVRRVVLPTAKAGLATALILGIARVAGETAPLLIVSGASSFMNTNPNAEPMNSLPLFIYDAIRRPDGLTIQARGYGAATLLLLMVLILFVVTRFLARDKGPSR
jgi:phosphate transport system permease protein